MTVPSKKIHLPITLAKIDKIVLGKARQAFDKIANDPFLSNADFQELAALFFQTAEANVLSQPECFRKILLISEPLFGYQPGLSLVRAISE